MTKKKTTAIRGKKTRVGRIALALFALSLFGVTATSETRPSLSVKGYLTTPGELSQIRMRAQTEPYKTMISEVIGYAGEPLGWSYSDFPKTLSWTNGGAPRYFSEGYYTAYAKALAYHLTGLEEYAVAVRDRTLALTNIASPNSNEPCAFYDIAIYLPSFIIAFDLVSASPRITEAHRKAFSQWLRETPYPILARPSATLRGEEGAYASTAAAIVSDYLIGSGMRLMHPTDAEKTQPPEEAFAFHAKMQSERMNARWKGNSTNVRVGIQPSGAIPDALERGSVPITATHFTARDESFLSTLRMIEAFTLHAETLRRRNDTSLFVTAANNGSGSLKKAIEFVVANRAHSEPWAPRMKSALAVAAYFYRSPAMIEHIAPFRYTTAGNQLLFAKATHYIPLLEALARNNGDARHELDEEENATREE